MLTFDLLRKANLARLPFFKNKHGKLAHTRADGSDWTPSDWLEAVTGELGEFANWHKKFRRGDISFSEFKEVAEKELADVAIYLDLLALRCLDHRAAHFAPWARNCWEVHPTGIDLGEAVRKKFNEVSERVGAPVFIAPFPGSLDYIVRDYIVKDIPPPKPAWGGVGAATAARFGMSGSSGAGGPCAEAARVTVTAGGGDGGGCQPAEKIVVSPETEFPHYHKGSDSVLETGEFLERRKSTSAAISRDIRRAMQLKVERKNAMGRVGPYRWLTRPVKLHHLRPNDKVLFVNRAGRTLYPDIYEIIKTSRHARGAHVFARKRNKEAVEAFDCHQFKARIITNLPRGLLCLGMFSEVPNGR